MKLLAYLLIYSRRPTYLILDNCTASLSQTQTEWQELMTHSTLFSHL